jgi:hypothetical protein
MQPGYRRADAGAGQVVRLQANPREPSQDADVGVAPVAASAQREADLEPGEVAGDPAERDTSRCGGGQDAACQLGTIGVRERGDRDHPVGVRASPDRPVDPRANGQSPLRHPRRADASHQLHHGCLTRGQLIAGDTQEDVRRVGID